MERDRLTVDPEALVEHVPDVVTVVDEQGRILYENRAVERLLGYDRSTAGERTILEHVHPDDRRAATAALTGDDASGSGEFRFRHPDGSTVWLDVLSTPLADEDGGGLLLAARDVSEHRQLVREGTAILERMTDAFCALDADWRFSYLNEHAEELLGREESELVGTEVWSAFPKSNETVLSDRLHEAMETGETVSFDLPYDPFDALFAVEAYPSETGLTIYFRDVTERRRVAREMEESVTVLHRLYKHASNPELSFEEKQSRVLELGRSYLDLPYGFVTRMTESTQRILAASGDHELLQPGESCPIEQSYCRKTVETDGILAMSDAVEAGWADDPAYDVFELGSYVGGKLLVNDELFGTLCFASTGARDHEFSDSERAFVEVSSRWLAYELEREQNRRELTERNERLEEFASFVSHDLRNPLNVAEGELELAMAEVESDHLDEVGWAHDRMRELIEDLLSVARGGDEVEEPTAVDLPTVVDACWRNVETDAATLVVDATRVVEADESRLRQLFENLFRNCVEHGSTSSRTGAGEGVGHAGHDVTVTVGDLDDGFYVADDGPGIPADEREQVFEAGYTTAADGTGFGLQIVDQVAEAHGWTVTATESDDGGARFEFTGVGQR
jgi:PAS domain S-box-containing protein